MLSSRLETSSLVQNLFVKCLFWSGGGENEKTEVFSSTGAGMMTSPSLTLNIVDEISR